MKKINLSEIHGQKYRVLSGVELGKQARKYFNINQLDSQPETISVEVPIDVFSLNCSFFAGLFHDSILKLKEKGFREKYTFECTEIIRKNIEDGIFYVINTKNLLED